MSERTATSVGLALELDRSINFAMQQNDVPPVRAVRIANGGEDALRDLRLRVVTEPQFAEPWECRLESLASGATYEHDRVDLVLSPKLLSELTERVRGVLRCQLYRGEDMLAEAVESVELLAHDEWSGLSSLPEILAAFVTPNSPAIERVLADAAGILREWTGDPALSGYQSKDNARVFMTAASIYTALQRLDITYINPPASFEETGQRIRLPERIVESKLGTCLDLAVLAASALEQAGLHPLVVLVRGHAFVATWLQEETFGSSTIEEPLMLRKRVDLNEIVVFDPTCISVRPSPEFKVAVEAAKRRLADPAEFQCAVDVARARKGRIRPLPQRVSGKDGGPEADRAETAALGLSAAPDVSGLAAPVATGAARPADAPETAKSRIDGWCRKLLDLSMNNRLLNFRSTKTAIPLLCPDAGKLEDALASGSVFKLLPRPQELGEHDPRDAEAHRRRTGDDGLANLLAEEMRASRLYADVPKDELDRRLLETYRMARTGLEEGGASGLYLAVGFLNWYETEQSQQPRMAPLLLLPLELHRRSVQEGFTLRLGDDEPRVNVSLVEMLKQDHAILIEGLDPIPEDDAGLDVPRVLRVFREAIKDVPRWDVTDSVRIGIFSFAKFLMWRDLAERAAELMQSPVVDHLVNRAGRDFDPGAAFPDPDRLDAEYPPARTYCPLPADASQLAAVFAAAAGRSFVLEGPPGTGKSQTITNLIAHCLAEGKKVLFVSEKIAALNVVHDRLKRVGLSRFCLELHSNKAQKSAVLGQLGDALEHAPARAPGDWDRESRQLQVLRDRLNEYAQALHKRRASGETVFHATSKLIELRDVPQVALRWPSAEALDGDDLSAIRDVVARVATTGAALGEVSGHPWTGVQRGDWTPAWQEQVREGVNSLLGSLSELEASAGDLSRRLTLPDAAWSLEQLGILDGVASLLCDPPPATTTILVRPEWDAIQARIGKWLAHGRKRDALRAALLEDYSEEILKLDLEGLQSYLREAGATWWPKGWWLRRRVRLSLKPVTRSGRGPDEGDVGAVLASALALRSEEKILADAGEQARVIVGRIWNDGQPAWDEIEGLRAWSDKFRNEALRAAGGDPEQAAALRRSWAALVADGGPQLRADAIVGREITRFRAAFTRFNKTRDRVQECLRLDGGQGWGARSAIDVLTTIRRRALSWQSHIIQLREWCAWRRCHEDATRRGLAPLVEGLERGEYGSNEVRRVFERSFYAWWHAAIVTTEPALSQFFSPEHAGTIERFRDADARFMQLTQEIIHARLAERVPAASDSELKGSEVGILKRELGKRRRQMTVRQLFRSIPNLIPRLKPCLLMSPMSVAQYLDGSRPPFDIVVFDEASQIPVWDSIGALARGRQAVVVGDPKQLPPTNFFQRTDDPDAERGDGAEVEDLQSVLDECIGSGLPQLTLNWHYRSRHESLIAFSNHHYYQNRLLTFPSPLREGVGVAWRPVPEGVYDRGVSATNRGEADAVVAEIVRRVKAAGAKPPSIGVVTFSQAQQKLIEDLLEQVRTADPVVDAAFAETVDEPIFVKNLESVQGDERDVILFSICYGPDTSGKVAMNFGPMNKDGGERRLNVAITRARTDVLVFSTLRADQINLSRSRARGIRDLKNFLEYAEKGSSALVSTASFDHRADVESPFESEVRDVLLRSGWEVHCQVGCASYRIDLAVVDPLSPGRYLLGVECDGANYHRAKTARDRDKLREGVLRSLGWKLHRIWSTDWWVDPVGETRKLEAAIEDAKRNPPAKPETPAPAPAEFTRFARVTPATPAAQAPTRTLAAPDSSTLPRYRAMSFQGMMGSQEDFYGPRADSQIRKLVVAVVEVEGPVSLDLASRRVAEHWGFSHVRAKAVERIKSLVPRDGVISEATTRGIFLWPRGVDPAAYKECRLRIPEVDALSKRDAADIHPREVGNAVLHVLRRHVSAPASELAREVSSLLGFGRAGGSVEDCMLAGIELLVTTGAATRDGAMVSLPQ